MIHEAPQELTIWYLRQHGLFDGVNAEAMESCSHLFVQRTYAPKTVLFSEGDDARIVYLVKRGRVRIGRNSSDGKEVTLAILGRGDIFGEDVAFSERVTRSTRATVIEESVLCLAKMHELVELVTRNPMLSSNMARYLVRKREEAVAVIEELVTLRVSGRIERLLKRLARDHGVETANGICIDVRLTHAEIAALVGSTRETVSIEIGRLRRKGAFTVVGGHFVLPSAEVFARSAPAV